ncbi:MAG: ADP-ribosylglycohydrolase family protein [Lacunisphaera sp.]
MIGAIIGDIAGSAYEFDENKEPGVPLFSDEAGFTDDTIMTIATARALLGAKDYRREYVALGEEYPAPKGGYGMRFGTWLRAGGPGPYDSWGNGSAMRVGPIGWAFLSLEETLAEAKRSAMVTHSHPEGVKGAQATATAIWLARHGKTKDEIRAVIGRDFGYDLSRTVEAIRRNYTFDESAQGTVPEAITAFLDSTDFESAIRHAISLGGDADTVGCITGAIAEAHYREIPAAWRAAALERLPAEFADTIQAFNLKYLR